MSMSGTSAGSISTSAAARAWNSLSYWRRAVVGELEHCTVARGLERFATAGPDIVLLVLALYATAVVVALATAALTGVSKDAKRAP